MVSKNNAYAVAVLLLCFQTTALFGERRQQTCMEAFRFKVKEFCFSCTSFLRNPFAHAQDESANLPSHSRGPITERLIPSQKTTPEKHN